MDAIDILKVARARIADPLNWGKGPRSRHNEWPGRGLNTCCASEAIEEVQSWGPERARAYRALEHAAGLKAGWDKLPIWNDASERTHAEVLAAYDLAIATLRLS